MYLPRSSFARRPQRDASWTPATIALSEARATRYRSSQTLSKRATAVERESAHVRAFVCMKRHRELQSEASRHVDRRGGHPAAAHEMPVQLIYAPTPVAPSHPLSWSQRGSRMSCPGCGRETQDNQSGSCPALCTFCIGSIRPPIRPGGASLSLSLDAHPH